MCIIIWCIMWCILYNLEYLSVLIDFIKRHFQFAEVAIQRRFSEKVFCSPVNLLHIFRTLFPKNTCGCLLLILVIGKLIKDRRDLSLLLLSKIYWNYTAHFSTVPRLIQNPVEYLRWSFNSVLITHIALLFTQKLESCI